MDEPAAMAERLRLLAADLLANGERRIRDRHFEDAILRAYRVLELVGQLRLFSHGLDSARLPPNHHAVRAVGARLAKKGSAGFGTNNKDCTLTAGRELVARLLREIGDRLAERLLKAGEMERKLTDRNHSVLIHGFEAVGLDDDAPLRVLYAALEQLLLCDAGDSARQHLDVARSLDFSAHSISSPGASATHSPSRTRPGEGAS
jgi:xanthine/CO dehydrogenase XdhC/CoxF family maturation factor